MVATNTPNSILLVEGHELMREKKKDSHISTFILISYIGLSKLHFQM